MSYMFLILWRWFDVFRKCLVFCTCRLHCVCVLLVYVNSTAVIRMSLFKTCLLILMIYAFHGWHSLLSSEYCFIFMHCCLYASSLMPLIYCTSCLQPLFEIEEYVFQLWEAEISLMFGFPYVICRSRERENVAFWRSVSHSESVCNDCC